MDLDTLAARLDALETRMAAAEDAAVTEAAKNESNVARAETNDGHWQEILSRIETLELATRPEVITGGANDATAIAKVDSRPLYQRLSALEEKVLYDGPDGTMTQPVVKSLETQLAQVQELVRDYIEQNARIWFRKWAAGKGIAADTPVLARGVSFAGLPSRRATLIE